MLQTYISCIKLRRYWREKIAHGVTSLSLQSSNIYR